MSVAAKKAWIGICFSLSFFSCYCSFQKISFFVILSTFLEMNLCKNCDIYFLQKKVFCSIMYIFICIFHFFICIIF